MNQQYAVIWLLLNGLSFALYGIDKQRAIRKKYRIPENVLLLASVFGVVGALFGMYLFRHKTRKLKFRVGVPLIMVAEVVLLTVLIYRKGFCGF